MAQPAAPILSVKSVHKSFDQNLVLKGVDFDFFPGKILGLMGENGAGKSTLMKICSGVLDADSGELYFEGARRTWRSVQDAIDHGVCFIHQELSVFPSLSVAENIFINPDQKSTFGVIDFKKRSRDTRGALDRIGAAHINPDARVSGLSIADRQSVEIARVLSNKQIRLLIMDEPTSALTKHEAEKLFERMRELAQKGVSIIFISHRLNEILQCCDEVAVLRDGEVVNRHSVEGLTADTVIREMVGRNFGEVGNKVPPAPDTADVAISGQNLGDGQILSGISFDVRFGEVLGIYGLVGSGRTELMRMLIGEHPQREGDIRYFDGAARPKGAPDAHRRGIVMVPESRKTQGILPNISVGHNITYGVLSRLFPMGWIRPRRELAFAAECAEAQAVRYADISQPIRFLSGGNQQKAILARAIAAAPKVLILDEPTLGVDINSKWQIYQTIRRLADEGAAIIMVSSELPEVLQLSSRIVVLSAGRSSYFGKNDDLTEFQLGAHAFTHLQ
jgi:ABC-type sugar transport system ATPase subunit